MSGKAALEIAAIVKKSVKSAESVAKDNRQKVEQGDGLVNETSQVLEQINTSVMNVLASAREILDTSKQQSSAIGQINVAVQQLDRDTQSMSATAEESAAAAAELDAQANSLNGIVGMLEEIVMGQSRNGSRSAGGSHTPPSAHGFSMASNKVKQLHKPL